MTKLRYLDLSEAGFSGGIPAQLGNLTNLRYLNLSTNCDNNYQGLFSNSLGRWASRLSKLQSVDMGSCNLSRATDTLQVLSTLPSLLILRLSDAGLQNTHLFNTSETVVFPALQHLDLSFNILEGPFPSILTKTMNSLKILSLSFNNFNGPLPAWLRNFKKLEFLDLRFNQFSHMEGGIWDIMSNPCNFKYLDLSGNGITGEILKPSVNSPECTTYDLGYLDLSGNKVNGSLPSLLIKLKNLNHLDLSSNKFRGQIPSNLTELSTLRFLDLSTNLLSGSTPKHLGKLTKIEHLGISLNFLQGTVLEIANLSKLAYLNVDCKNLDLNPDFAWQPLFQLHTLKILFPCEQNTVFPQWLRTQNRIERLDLSGCGFSGNLPQYIGNLTNLGLLFLANNRFTGSLPHNFSGSLGYLDLSNNFLTGPLPRHIVSNELHYLNLHNNMFSGLIPHWLGHLETLYYVDLSTNQLSGTISEGKHASSLLTSSFIMNLDLSYNKLSGEMHFRNVSFQSNIISLNLRGNDLSGIIPSELCSLSGLVFMDLGENYLTGQIPTCFGLIFQRSSTGEIKNPRTDVTEIIKRQQEVFIGSSWLASNLDLSNNNLVGTIPEAMTNISTLVGLNLSYNHLTGDIPKNIGNMISLESLDLSNNHLSGTIPDNLSSLTALSSLNLSNNYLHGQIPTGSQLQTLDDPSIYYGNCGLCGFPLHDCTEPNSRPSKTNNYAENDRDKKEREHERYWLYLVIMIGFATGFWGVVGTLVLNISWRHAYFRFVEEIANKIYVEFKVKVNSCMKRPANLNHDRR